LPIHQLSPPTNTFRTGDLPAMNRTKRSILAGAGLSVVVLVAAGLLLIPSVEDAVFEHLVEHHLRAGSGQLLQGDALKVLLCGTSAPTADEHRAQSCVAIIAGGTYFLVDTGPGSSRNLELWQLRGHNLGAIFLTHFHSDHIGDLGEVNTNAWLDGHPGRIPVFGGPGVEQVVEGFNQAYAQDHAYRTANVGAALLPPATGSMQATAIPLAGPPTKQKDRRSTPLHFGDLTVTAIEVNHDPAEPAYAYRFDYHGRSAVISGDTQHHPPLASAAQGTDVLVHEAQPPHLVQLIGKAASQTGNSRLAQIMADIQQYHTAPPDAARIANAAHARLLVFTHFNPPVDNPLLHRMLYRGVNQIRGHGWISGVDGTLITLPARSTTITTSTLTP
jgi:ribonuclease Z